MSTRHVYFPNISLLEKTYKGSLTNQQTSYQYFNFFTEKLFDAIVINSYGESSNARDGFIKNTLFGVYNYLKDDERGNKIYKKKDSEYFLFKSKNNNWLVSSEI